ncbi:MAG: hypothetical protein ACM3Q2_05525 [Syntrophothermus sp.]
MNGQTEESLSRDKLDRRFEYAAWIADFILREELAKGGYEIAGRNIAEHSRLIAEEICLYCGANEGLDFFSDEDVIRSAFLIMSEGSIQLSPEELSGFRARINPILPDF